MTRCCLALHVFTLAIQLISGWLPETQEVSYSLSSFKHLLDSPIKKKYKSKYSGAVSMHFVPAFEMGSLYPRGRIFFFKQNVV